MASNRPFLVGSVGGTNTPSLGKLPGEGHGLGALTGRLSADTGRFCLVDGRKTARGSANCRPLADEGGLMSTPFCTLPKVGYKRFLSGFMVCKPLSVVCKSTVVRLTTVDRSIKSLLYPEVIGLQTEIWGQS